MKKFFLFLMLIFVGCDSKKDSKDSIESSPQNALETQSWAFSKRYMKALSDNTWEQLNITPLNNYADFKIDFTLISMGKPQNCTLYSKGIFLNSNIHAQEKIKNKKTIMFRPNLIPSTTITISQENKNKNVIKVTISNIDSFTQTCGNAHTSASGEYSLSD